MFDAIILMAGKGERTGLSFNKILYKVNNKPLFQYSLETFLKSPFCHQVVLVVSKTDEKEVKNLINDLPNVKLTIGGNHRQDSVQAGIALCEEKIVLIHDAARPLLDLKSVDKVYQETLKNQAAVLATPTIDTIINSELGYNALKREHLWNVQTPQGVNLDAYRLASKQAYKEGYYASDDISLMVKYLNIKPVIVPGSSQNIKVTSKYDLEYIEYLLGRS
jgi:2-C-methyl-D-erythritol 4-phosphate cytidylyltransferase